MRAVLKVVFLLVAASGAASAKELPDVIDAVRPAIVGVGTAYPPRQPIAGQRPNQLMGTGFAVGNGQLVVTNHHVLPEILDYENRQSLAIFAGRGRNAKVHVARVVARDKEHDLAILRIESTRLPTVFLGDSSTVREGETMAFTGFPIGAVLGLYPVTHQGIVSSITPIARTAGDSSELSAVQLQRMRNRYDVFQLDAIAYPGNSGSPVFRPDSGEVIGVVNSVFVKESREAVLERPSGISYAIPVEYVHALLESIGGGG